MPCQKIRRGNPPTSLAKGVLRCRRKPSILNFRLLTKLTTKTMNRHYKTLELDKILERLAGLTSLPDAKDAALALEPQTDIKKVELLLRQTDDAVALSGRFGAPSFGGAVNCAGNLRRAEAGGVLRFTVRERPLPQRSGLAGGHERLPGLFAGL